MNAGTIKISVWVVDDEVGMCRAVGRALDGWTDVFNDLQKTVSYQTELLNSGEAFIEKNKSENPDILLLDGKLPGIGGIEILALLHQKTSMPVTIMITAYASIDKAVRATKLGAWDFLAKPFTPEELRNTIRKAARNVILIQKAQFLEEERRKLRFNFLSVLAHELKAPIDAIDGYVRLIQSRQAGNELPSYDSMIERIGFRALGMRKLISDLLDLTRIEAGEGKRTIRSIDVRTLAEASMDLYRESAAAKSVTMRMESDALPDFLGDSAEIEMLFNNLLSNAVKYNTDGGSVLLSIRKRERGVCIICKDTGIGMTEEEASRLFREFSRIKNANTRSISGSGLGLTIVQKIAYRYSGTVRVESEPGKGSVFTVELSDGTKSAEVNPVATQLQ